MIGCISSISIDRVRERMSADKCRYLFPSAFRSSNRRIASASNSLDSCARSRFSSRSLFPLRSNNTWFLRLSTRSPTKLSSMAFELNKCSCSEAVNGQIPFPAVLLPTPSARPCPCEWVWLGWVGQRVYINYESV